ncbi:MAG: Ig-like domain-containing protein, partial [Tannerellaceae bacterium]|nr:Ig-like domain-containing protein [Tannerellaceae bacterium]
MKKLSILSLSLLTLLCNGCIIDEVVTTGSISGVVKDAQTKGALENVSVALSPGGLSKLTGKDGAYAFGELEAKEYTLTFTKQEYISVSKESTVQARANNIVDISLVLEPVVPILKINHKSLDFGKDSETLSLEISNTGKGSLDWRIEQESSWFSCSPSAGSTGKEKSTVVVTVSRTQKEKGTYRQTFSIASNGGREDVTVTMEVAGANLAYEPLELDFGKLTTSLPLLLTNKGTNTINYTVETSNNWIIPEKTSGRITTTDKLNVLVSRESLSAGDYNGSLVLKSGNESYAIPVKMTISPNSKPVISINPVSEITTNSVTLSGVIADVGRSEITKHGFCLSASPNPTVSDLNFNLGDCSVPKSFEKIVSDLQPNTTYYAKAYAENSFGISYSAQISFTTPGIPVTDVSLNKTSLSLPAGSTEQLTATVSPSDASNKAVSWTSSDTRVATVSSTGLVTGVSNGSATITVTTADGNMKVNCYVTVTIPPIPVTDVLLNKTSLSLGIGATEQLTATVLPSNATDKKVRWSSSNLLVATVSSTGLVTGVSDGSATITVTTADGNKKATCNVSVISPISVTGVSLNKTSIPLGINATEQLTATVFPSNATNKNVSWESSNTTVASVSANGLVTGKAEGSATITVITQDGNKTATCTVTVTGEKGGTTGTLTWKLSNGTLTISGTGAMPHYSSNNNAPWSYYRESITNVIIGNGVANIGNLAFCYYYYYYNNTYNSYTNLKSITISNTVTKIGSYAFYGSSLESVTIPNSVTEIG